MSSQECPRVRERERFTARLTSRQPRPWASGTPRTAIRAVPDRQRLAAKGIVQVRSTRFHVTRKLVGQTVLLVETADHLLVFDDRGTEIMRHPWPAPGTATSAPADPAADTHEPSNHPKRNRCPDTELSPMS